MNTKVWGPPMWRIIHSVAHVLTASSSTPTVPTTIVHSILPFFHVLRRCLPCKHCRKSSEEIYRRVLRNYISDTDTNMGRDDLIRIWEEGLLESFWYDFHQMVNYKLYKQHQEKLLSSLSWNGKPVTSSEILPRVSFASPVPVPPFPPSLPAGLTVLGTYLRLEEKALFPIPSPNVAPPETTAPGTLSLDCLTKRYRIHPVQCTPMDVLDSLLFFTMRFKESTATTEDVAANPWYADPTAEEVREWMGYLMLICKEVFAPFDTTCPRLVTRKAWMALAYVLREYVRTPESYQDATTLHAQVGMVREAYCDLVQMDLTKTKPVVPSYTLDEGVALWKQWQEPYQSCISGSCSTTPGTCRS